MLPNIVLFEGIDANNRTGLWETNGTAAGTFELTTSVATSAPYLGRLRLSGKRPTDSYPTLQCL